MKAIAIAAAGLLLTAGCCTYQGKYISRREAEHMAALGMDVHCWNEPKVVNGEYTAAVFQPGRPCRHRRRSCSVQNKSTRS
jgi:hypothetical protein